MIFFYSNQTGTSLYFKSYIKKKTKYFIFTNKKKLNLINNLKNQKKILNFRDIILFIKKFNPNFFYISATKDKIEDQIIKLLVLLIIQLILKLPKDLYLKIKIYYLKKFMYQIFKQKIK